MTESQQAAAAAATDPAPLASQPPSSVLLSEIILFGRVKVEIQFDPIWA